MRIPTALRGARWRLRQWLRRTFAPPRYYVATFGDMGLEVEFYRDRAAFEAAAEQAEERHDSGRLDSWMCGDVEAAP